MTPEIRKWMHKTEAEHRLKHNLVEERPKAPEMVDISGDGSLRKKYVVESSEPQASVLGRSRPEWGDKVYIRTAASGHFLVQTEKEEENLDPKVRRKRREARIAGQTMRELRVVVGEAPTKELPLTDFYSLAACSMVPGEVADVYFEDGRSFGLSFLKWEPRKTLPEGAVEVVELPASLCGAGQSSWKVVWRAGKAPWLVANAKSDISFKRSELRDVGRPPSQREEEALLRKKKNRDFEGDDIDEDYDGYVDPYEDEDDAEFFVQPEDWDDEILFRREESCGKIHDEQKKKSLLRTCLENMAKGERATFYFRGFWKELTFDKKTEEGFARLLCFDVELQDWADNEVLAPGVVKKIKRKAKLGEWKSPKALDKVKVQIFEETFDWALDSGDFELPSQPLWTPNIEVALLNMKRGEAAQVTFDLRQEEDFVFVENKEPLLSTNGDDNGEESKKEESHGEEDVSSGGEKVSCVVTLLDFEAVDWSEDRARELKRLGNECFERGDLKRALRRYEECLAMAMGMDSLEATRVSVYSNVAAVHIRTGSYRAALRSCDTALALDPEKVQALRRKAKAHVLLGELTEAVKPMKRCLELAPQDKQARTEANDLHRRLKIRKNKTKAKFATEFKAKSSPKEQPTQEIHQQQLLNGQNNLSNGDNALVPTATDLKERRHRHSSDRHPLPVAGDHNDLFEDFEDFSSS